MNTCIYVCMYRYLRMCTYYVCMNKCMYVYMCVCVCVYVNLYV